jgi:hypothetical protein
MKIVNKFSKPVKIGVTILLVGVAVMAYGTFLNSDTISYYALLIIITGLFIYLAYTLNFVNKSNLDHTTTEKEKGKKRKK